MGSEDRSPKRPRALILLSHPNWAGSVVQRAMVEAVEDLADVSVRRLDALYPDFEIDVAAEQDAVRDHSLIVFQHPLYWYSSPPLLKQWIDCVLLREFAFGRRDPETKGKMCWSAVSAGGPESAYGEDGFNAYSIETFLIPFERTAAFCKMRYAPPLILHNTYGLESGDLQAHADKYRRQLLEHLAALSGAPPSS